MSALSSIRNNMGIVIIIVAIALLAFILGDLFSANRGVTARPEIGTVAGETVSFEDYSQRLNVRLDNARASNPEGSIDDRQRYQIMDQTWNEIVQEISYQKELESAGLEVTGAELADMFVGRNISPIVQQYFQPFFDYKQEPFSAQGVREYIELIQDNEEELIRFKQFEDYMLKNRAQQRYLNMVKYGYLGSKQAAQQQYVEQNKSVDISFLAVNYTQIPDSTVSVSDAEIEAYIEAHPKEFEQDEETYINYVQFNVVPQREDSVRARTGVEKYRSSFAGALDDSIYVSNKTRTPYLGTFSSPAELNPSIRDSLINGDDKAVYGPVMVGGFYKMFKLVEKQKNEDDEIYAKVRHIQIRYKGASESDTTDARKKAAELKRKANKDNFAELAKENSDDYTAAQGGDLSWYRRGAYGPGFDEAIDEASVGSIIGPVKGNQGYHVIHVLEKTPYEYAVAEIEKEIYAGSNTVRAAYKAANEFAAKAQQDGDLQRTAQAEGLAARRSNPIKKETKFITGVNSNSRQVALWAIKAEVNSFSEVFDGGDSYVFAQVAERKEEGLQSADDARSIVEPKVMNEKKAEIIKQRLSGATDLEGMRAAFGDGAFVDKATGVTFSSNQISKIGQDPLLIGKVMGMEMGEISQPLAGTNGVYVVQVTNVNEPEPADEATLTSLQQSDALTGQNAMQSKADRAIVEIADPDDNRAEADY
ncbi:MAG: SurA N-terminal domain-containing protein [Bacteroidota bacterium]